MFRTFRISIGLCPEIWVNKNPCNKPTKIQVMAPSHFLNQCWPRSPIPSMASTACYVLSYMMEMHDHHGNCLLLAILPRQYTLAADDLVTLGAEAISSFDTDLAGEYFFAKGWSRSLLHAPIMWRISTDHIIYHSLFKLKIHGQISWILRRQSRHWLNFGQNILSIMAD